MEIQKVFSDMYDEERIYSVLMSEDEVALYSEFQKEFARRDYEGLTSGQAAKLRENRDLIAQTFRDSRKQTQNKINSLESTWNNLKPGSGMYVGGNNGERLNIIKSTPNASFKGAVNQASKFNATQDLKSISELKNLARQDALKSAPNFLQRNKGKLGIAALAGVGLGTAAYLRNRKKDKED